MTHARVIENEVMETSDGQRESFPLLHQPVLEPRDLDDGDDPNPDEWVVEVGAPGNWEAWRRVEYFSPVANTEKVSCTGS